jgi:hypothetical protein
MAGFFGKLFGKKETNEKSFTEMVREGAQEIIDPNDVHQRVAIALMANLQTQVSLLGHELWKVPPEGKFISKDCRGYLYGLALGVIVEENIERTKDSLIDTIQAAFAMVYGVDLGKQLSLQTFQEAQAGDKEILWASDRAIEEIARVYSSGGDRIASGFYQGATSGIF